MPQKEVTPQTTLENLKREAKRWLKALRDGTAESRDRLAKIWPEAPALPTLRDIQHALAREYGLAGWSEFRTKVDMARGTVDPTLTVPYYERLAADFLDAYLTGSEQSLAVVHQHAGHHRTLDATRRYMRVDLGKPEHADVPLTLDDTKLLVARGHDFANWAELTRFIEGLAPRKTAIAKKPVELFAGGIGEGKYRIAAERAWELVLEMLGAGHATELHAPGEMTDHLLGRVADCEHVVALNLNGSKQVTDDGIRHLAGMPQLRYLDLSGCSITDAGLVVLRELPALERIALSWTGITDNGAAHLAACKNLEGVNLFWTNTGDGAIRALMGKPRLRAFQSGEGVTDAGLPLLHGWPVLKNWQGGDMAAARHGFGQSPNSVMLRGTYTDRGIAELAGLDGLFGLDIESEEPNVTGASLAPLASLPRLGSLAFICTDEAMPYVAALPHLRFLMCQDTVAGDDGFEALSKSRSIERIWGRRCHNLGSRGFAALAKMPALSTLSVSCLNVGDDAIATLPDFPALRELMPMDIPDEGYRHIGRCSRLEKLTLMYCRTTTDRATEHIVGMSALRRYFASYTQITDRTPELLSGVQSLEDVEFSACAGLTTAGIASLARLPGLKKLRVEGMPNVSRDILTAFPKRVEVHYGV